MASKILAVIDPAATVVFTDSTGDEGLPLSGLFFGLAAYSEFHDFGVSPRTTQYYYRMQLEFVSGGNIGDSVRLYLIEADIDTVEGAPNNDVGENTTSSNVDKLRNLDQLDSLEIDSATANIVMVKSGLFVSAARHIGVVVFNNTNVNLRSLANQMKVELTPVEPEVQ